MNTLTSWWSILCSEQTPINMDISMMAIARIKMPQWWCHLLHVAVKVDSVPFMPSFKLFMLLMKAFRNSATQPGDNRCVRRIKALNFEKKKNIYTGDFLRCCFSSQTWRVYTFHWKGAMYVWCLNRFEGESKKPWKPYLVVNLQRYISPKFSPFVRFKHLQGTLVTLL